MTHFPQAPLRCDLFCQVIDNFGDIGICWRLAKQLHQEYDWSMTLFVDNLHTLSQLVPMINPKASIQHYQGVTIIHWTKHPSPVNQIADVVIEAFACDIPLSYIQQMASSKKHPIWINLEYLSAESWIDRFHLQPSYHPQYSLRKTFFFPGLSPKSGGLILENTLLAQRDAFLSSKATQQAWWRDVLKIDPPDENRTIISLFSYDNPAIIHLLQAWRLCPITLIVPYGQISQNIAQALNLPDLSIGKKHVLNQLHIISTPFVEQTAYDPLLWLSDLNFVRGEDSFVRAQWAAKPFIWHIYPQQEEAHLIKLHAVLDLFTQDLDQPISEAVKETFLLWNKNQAFSWSNFWKNHNILQIHMKKWTENLTKQGNLAQKLVEFVDSQLK